MIKPRRVRALMAYHGYTCEQLAAKVGCSDTTITRILNYPVPKDRKYIDKIAQALGTKPGAISDNVVLLKFQD